MNNQDLSWRIDHMINSSLAMRELNEDMLIIIDMGETEIEHPFESALAACLQIFEDERALSPMISGFKFDSFEQRPVDVVAVMPRTCRRLSNCLQTVLSSYPGNGFQSFHKVYDYGMKNHGVGLEALDGHVQCEVTTGENFKNDGVVLLSFTLTDQEKSKKQFAVGQLQLDVKKIFTNDKNETE